MSSEHHNTDGGRPKGAKRPYVFSPWKKLACVGAGALLVLGLGLYVFGAAGGSRATSRAGTKEEGTAALDGTGAFMPGSQTPVPTGTGGSGGDQSGTLQAEEASPWPPLLVKGGGGFLMGFSIGFALRKFLRMSIAVIGLVLVGLFGLQYLGCINVNWSTVQEQFNAVGTRLQAEFQSFTTFIAGMLPTSGMAALGLFTGFKRQ